VTVDKPERYPALRFQEKDKTMNEQISTLMIGANTASIVQNSKPVLIGRRFAGMNRNIEDFSYVLKVVALTHLYNGIKFAVACRTPSGRGRSPLVDSDIAKLSELLPQRTGYTKLVDWYCSGASSETSLELRKTM
jgi:hypothetical protein